jgi:hypothetical protein
MQRRHWIAGALASLAALAVVATASAAPPQNTAAPTISGTAREGQTLTADNGTWANSPTSFTYQWQRCAADGSGCVNIAGATAKTYTAAAADVDRRLRVVVTAINADGQASANSAPTAIVSSGQAPTNTAKPTIAGTAAVGEQLTASPGTWTGGVSSYLYQWQRCAGGAAAACTNIAGATNRTYTVRTADIGSALRVNVTARNASGSTATAASDLTPVVGGNTTTVVTTTTTTTAGAVNRAPTISLLSARKQGVKAYVRFRVCDDSGKNLTVLERDTKRGLSYRRKFTTGPCGTYSKSWKLTKYFRSGPVKISLQATDKSGKSSRTVSRTVR